GKDQEKDDKGKGKDQEKDDKGKGKDQEKDDKGTGNTPVASENDAVDRNLGNSVLKASKDTYLRKSASDTNEGANEILRLTHIGSNRVLVAFDLSGIEGNVESATLQLFIVTNENDWKEVGQIGKTIMHQTISAHVLTRYWEEGNGSNELSGRSTGNGPGATWHCAIDSEIKNNKPDCSDKWQGGEFEGSSDEIYITNGMTGEWVEFDVTSDVIKFISGEKTNYGWLIKKDQENLHGALSFASSETDNGPRLVLERSRAPTNSSAPGNSPPAANDDSAYTNEDTPTMINVLLNDFAPDGDDLTATIADGPAHGNVTMTAPGSATYTPAPDYHGTDSFTYVVSDGQATDTATVTIVVNPVNDLPVAESQEIAVQKGTTVTITLTATDIDGDNLTYIVVGSPAHGTLGEDDGNHTITYTPAMGFVGEDGFTFKANDGNADSNIATVSIYVDGLPNQAPIAIDDTATTDEDNPVTIDVLSNDSDPDGDVISIDGITTPCFL
ncbi:MAG: tandem-95 repeat protein, partial [Nitrososphaera sp.]